MENILQLCSFACMRTRTMTIPATYRLSKFWYIGMQEKHYSYKEHLNIGNIAKFGREMM